MIEAGVATLEAADAGQAGAVDADRGGPAARGIGNHVTAEQAEHGVDLVVVEFLGQIPPVENTQPIAAPDKVRQEPLAGPVGQCVQWCRFTRRPVPPQVLLALRPAVAPGVSARSLLLPLGGPGG